MALGLILVVVVLLVATWLGSWIRTKYLAPKSIVSTPLVETNSVPPESLLDINEKSSVVTSPVTTIPQTGPNELALAVLISACLPGWFLAKWKSRLS